MNKKKFTLDLSSSLISKKLARLVNILKKLALPLICVLLLTSCSSGHLYGVLNPKGLVATQERKIMFDCIALMLIVVIPVIIMSFAFTSRYNAKKNNPDYKPNWAHNTFLECIWWGVPCVLIVILGIITWQSSHKLDPYRKLDIPGKTLVIQAVSLQWKWLFIYPKQDIATVNYIEIPKDQQVEF
jgi:cytochrome o ubiquinol oxidase subunit II